MAGIREWLRRWVTLPARWRRHEEDMRRHASHWREFSSSAIAMGYGERTPAEAAVQIARRCQGAEWELKRVTKDLMRERAERQAAAAIEMCDPTPAEFERLAKLAEECGELVRAVGKVQLHGWESTSPYTGRTNREALEREIGSVRAVVGLLLDSGDVRLGELQGWQRSKKGKLSKWMHHQVDSPTREQQLAMMREIELSRLPQ